MSLESLVDDIMPWAKGWNRDGTEKSVLALIENGINELFDYDSLGMIFRTNSNEGFPPYLQTVAGTYKYDIVSANLSENLVKTFNSIEYNVRCRRVLRIFVDVTSTEFDLKWLGAPYTYSVINPLSPRLLSRLFVSDIGLDIYPPTEDDPAYVIFREDPQTTTDRYFADLIWEPPAVTSENNPFIAHKNFRRAIRDFCIGEIQMLANGNENKFQQKFEDYWKPRFRQEMSWSLGADNKQVVPTI